MRSHCKILLLFALTLATSVSAAQPSFPARPLRLIVGSPAGGGNDIVGRILALKLSENFGQQVIVDNRGGANGIIGMELAAKAAPDGHTLYMGTAGHLSVNAVFYAKLPFNIDRDFVPLTEVVSLPFLIWYGMVLPAGTPRDRVMRLHSEIVRVMNIPEIRAKLIAQGTDPVGSTPSEFAAFRKAEEVKWARVIKGANIRTE